VARIAEAVTGPTPGMVISRLAVSSALTDAASSLSIAPIAASSASIWPTSGRSAARTQSGTPTSPLSSTPSYHWDGASNPMQRPRGPRGRGGERGAEISSSADFGVPL